ncbi:MAG: DUF721 domain-containing protein [Paludibacteraceae bacterium]|nr:DUF721 domain-containing protein [Paludibacteraceae bacterium]
MDIHDPQSITDLLSSFIRDNHLEQPYLERRIIEAWPSVLGNAVVRFTGDMNIRDGVLFVHIKSAPLRQELFNNRHLIVERLNQAVGATHVLKDIRLLG